jgi:hypothetical protein
MVGVTDTPTEADWAPKQNPHYCQGPSSLDSAAPTSCSRRASGVKRAAGRTPGPPGPGRSAERAVADHRDSSGARPLGGTPDTTASADEDQAPAPTRSALLLGISERGSAPRVERLAFPQAGRRLDLINEGEARALPG